MEEEIINSLNSPVVQGLSLLGGEPLEPQNQYGILDLLRRIKRELPDKDIWCYTGYTLETDLVGAGSVITRDIPANTVWYGNPARHRGYVTDQGVMLDMDKRDKAGKQHTL